MRAIFAFIFSAVFITIVATGNSVHAGAKDSTKMLPAVATILGQDKVKLHGDVVKKTFADGGQVNVIGIQKINGKLFLMRFGRDANGGARTEALGLERRGTRLVPIVPIKIKTCYQPTCSVESVDDGSDSSSNESSGDGPLEKLLDSITITGGFDINTCMINDDTCSCSLTGTDCIFGIATNMELHDFVIWQ